MDDQTYNKPLEMLSPEETEMLGVALATLNDSNALFGEGYSHLVFALKSATGHLRSALEAVPGERHAMLLELIIDEAGRFGIRFVRPE